MFYPATEIKTYYPNRGSQQTQIHTTEVGVDGLDNQVGIQLHSDAHTHNTKVHHQQRPQSPVQEHGEEITHRPRSRVVHPLHVMVMDHRILALQCGFTVWDPAHQRVPLRAFLARRSRTIRKPPEEHEAKGDGDHTVDEEHPLEADEALGAIHLLEAG